MLNFLQLTEDKALSIGFISTDTSTSVSIPLK